MADLPQLDVAQLTLGEMDALERASGLAIEDILRRKPTRLMAALFVLRSRSSGSAPSWNELRDLRLSDLSSSDSPSGPAGVPETSPS